MAVIRANRESIDDRFSVLGFTVRSELPLFEIAIATDPELLRPEHRARRTPRNFFASRLQRAPQAMRGDAVYLVPPDVVARFVGQQRLYFGMATYRENDRSTPVSLRLPDRGSLYVNIAGLSERGLRRTSRRPGPGGYGDAVAELGWGGDAAGNAPAATREDSARRAATPTKAADPAPYSDGYSDDLWKQPAASAAAPANTAAPAPAAAPASAAQALRGGDGAGYGRALADDSDDDRDIGGPIPDDLASAQAYGTRGLALTAPEYPGARRFEPAATGNYRAVSGKRTIDRIVIHITDGGANINGTIGWFKNPAAKVSAHYVIGQDGEVVQMVAHNDVAWHAGSANGTSIGIEHVANTRGLMPTVRQMEASAALVTWLCDTYGIEAKRENILGHAEADGKTTHTGCPNAVWNWDYYMTLISTRSCVTPPASMPQSLSAGGGYGRALADDEDDDDPDRYGITGDEPEAFASAAALGFVARSLAAETPDYPGASRFAPAATGNFRKGRRRGAVIDRIVIHITAGGPKIDGTIGWFQNPAAKVSSHYVVGRDGEVVQMVRDADTAYHASSANSRSIGIEHNANKPYKLNKRDLPPTEPQYAGSARLVAWLCATHGVPVDRDHIVGHKEASPGDNHDCPSSYWNWDRYMDLVKAEARALGVASVAGTVAGAVVGGVAGAAIGAAAGAAARAAVSSGQSYARGGYASAQEILEPFYDAKDPSTALSCQNDAFSLEREEWFVGVEDTSAFPHSAICRLATVDAAGKRRWGTGFYVGRNRILTAAHVLNGKTRVTIVPGKNGDGADSEPYGQTTVEASSWRIAPTYTGSGNHDNDIAVIDNVPIDAPNGRWFEFLNATPSRRLPIVVCGYSGQSDKVPALNKIIDSNKQHLHGGYAAEMSTLEVIEYPILALHGASGAPVYTLEKEGGTFNAKVCGVHVSGEPAAKGLNRGCFLTPAKLDWIEGRAASFSLAAARAGSLGVLDTNPVDLKLRVFIPSPAILMSRPIISDRAFGGDGRGFQLDGGTSRAEIHARLHFGSGDEKPRLEMVSTPKWGESTEYSVDDTEAVSGKPGWYRNRKSGAQPIDRATLARTSDNLYAKLGGDSTNGIISMAERSLVVTFHVEGSLPLVALSPDIDANLYVHVRINGDKVEARVVGGHDGFPAYELYANGKRIYSYNPLDHGAGPGSLFGPGVWDVEVDTSYVDCGDASEYRLIGPVRIQSLAYGRALAGDGPSDYDVHLIPQPDKNACWAASMAMLIAYRGQMSRTPEAIVNEVGSSLATSYGWELIKAAKKHYGFQTLEQPSNTSLYHSPRQWAEWLNACGPLWVVIVGAPHAVVLAGIRGNRDDASDCKVKLLNPWDTRVNFDNDPVEFHPANNGYADWLSFEEFASDFGNMAESNYGNWRILHLPASAAAAQSLGVEGTLLRLKPAPAPVRAQRAGDDREEPIEPSRVAGARMRRIVGEAGACRWALDQLDGMKSPASPGFEASSAAQGVAKIALDDWPAIEGAPTPLPITVEYRHDNGSLGDVRIVHGLPANLAYGVEATAKIEDCADDGRIARLRVRVDYRFRGLAQSNPDATVELVLRGDGRHERDNQWRNAEALSPAA